MKEIFGVISSDDEVISDGCKKKYKRGKERSWKYEAVKKQIKKEKFLRE